jgi:hypothetical protein
MCVPNDNPQDSGVEHVTQSGVVVPDDNPAEAKSIASPAPNVDDVA